MKTYEILRDGKAIKCLICGKISYNPNDVFWRYCAYCHTFHELAGDDDET